MILIQFDDDVFWGPASVDNLEFRIMYNTVATVSHDML